MVGSYITFEGPEGCGKSTQLKLLGERLKDEGYNFTVTKEPGGNTYPSPDILAKGIADSRRYWLPTTQGIRECLLDPAYSLTPEQESLLFWTDRIIHHQTFVYPSIASGKLVLGDRDFDSSWAYQHYARGLAREWMEQREREAIGNFKPNLTLLYVGDVDHFLKRVNRRRLTNAEAAAESRIDDEQLDFHVRVQDGFLDRAKNEPARFRILDGMLGIEELQQQTYAVVKNYLDSR